MDHMERAGTIPRGLVAFGVALLFLAGCGANDDATPVESVAAPTAPTAPTAPPVATPEALADEEPTEPPVPTATPTVTPTPTPTPTPLPPLRALDTELVVKGLLQPIGVTGAPGTSALFVVERHGRIMLVEDGERVATPFLDLRNQLNSGSIEQGLLGLAFHPDYETNGRFYAYWTQKNGDSRLAEFTASSPTTVDPETMRVILDVDKLAIRHNAGSLAFGPDGLLYVAFGDGGSGGANGQDTSNLLGSVVRIDVDGGDPYSIPAGNPFGDELFVYGLRNPWRISVDAKSRLLYIGDVGQDRFEEVNVVSVDDGGGTNFGWRPMEGGECFDFTCDKDGKTLPTVQYNHDEGCSISGGLVYRGSAIPELDGHYFYGDWCSGLVRSFRLDDGNVEDEADWTSDLAELGQITSFGVDNDGELHVVNWDGELFKIIPVR